MSLGVQWGHFGQIEERVSRMNLVEVFPQHPITNGLCGRLGAALFEALKVRVRRDAIAHDD